MSSAAIISALRLRAPTSACAARVQRHSAFSGTRVVTKAQCTAGVRLRARGRPCRLVTSANVIWTLEVNQEWCDIAADTCEQVFPLDLSSMIDSQRPGPNKTWSIKVGGPRDGGQVCPEDDLDLVIDIAPAWFSEETVSGLHAEFEENEDGDLFVSDCHSQRGTYVNGEKISAKTQLHPGDTVSFGKKGIVFTATRDVKAHA